MKILLILQDKNGQISHHYPIEERELSRTEKELTRLQKKIIYTLFIKTSFSIQRTDAGENTKNETNM